MNECALENSVASVRRYKSILYIYQKPKLTLTILLYGPNILEIIGDRSTFKTVPNFSAIK